MGCLRSTPAEFMPAPHRWPMPIINVNVETTPATPPRSVRIVRVKPRDPPLDRRFPDEFIELIPGRRRRPFDWRRDV